MSKSQHWKSIIKQWKDSGLTQKQFCDEQEIKIATLHYWIKKFRTAESVREEPRFLPLNKAPAPCTIKLRLCGAVIELSIHQLPDVLVVLQQNGFIHASA
jgi:hypothetical protein